MKPESVEITACAVKAPDGGALLFDFWVAGVWVGSRRTVEQCETYLSGIVGVPVEATAGRAW